MLLAIIKIMHSKWTLSEDAVINEFYPKINATEVAKYLPNRTNKAIRARAVLLGINKHPELCGRKLWTKEEDQIIIDNYQNEGSDKLAKRILGRTNDSIRARIQFLGLKSNRPKVGVRQYTLNETFFSITNQVNSYVAGFLSGDCLIRTGYSARRGNVNQVALKLSLKDEVHLQKIKDIVGYSGPLKYEKNEGHPSCKLTICSKQLVDDLDKNFGVVEWKPYRRPPDNLSPKLYFYFLMGLIDADGSIIITYHRYISKVTGKEAYYARFRIGISSSGYKILHWVRNFLNANFEYRKGKQNVYRTVSKAKVFSIHNIRAAIVFNYLYNIDCPWRLDRKWENPEVLSLIQNYKVKYSQYFIKPLDISQNSTIIV